MGVFYNWDNKMSDQHGTSSYDGMSRLLIAVIFALTVPALLISLLAKSLTSTTAEAAQPEAAVKQVAENIKPVADVVVASASAGAAHAPKSGEEVVKAVCSMCHGAGLMGSPKIGDADQWGPRASQGYDTLVKNAINGIRAMPARGGNPDLTDEEVAAAVKYMANNSGAKF